MISLSAQASKRATYLKPPLSAEAQLVAGTVGLGISQYQVHARGPTAHSVGRVTLGRKLAIPAGKHGLPLYSHRG